MALNVQLSRPGITDSARETPHWVRELTPMERRYAAGRTGDLLPDGSVLLRQEDMNRMGLEQLRKWILKNVRTERSIVLAGRGNDPSRPLVINDLT
jgi:hypothetical protein